MKRVRLFTLGCKVNQYETQAIREKFLSRGYREVHTKTADVYVINTCTVTHQADRDSRRLIRRALHCSPQSKIVVTGCYVESDACEILQISDRIQVIPNRKKHLIVELLNSPDDGRGERKEGAFIPLAISNFKDHQRAFLKIQDGCNNFCSYCKVPVVRGESRSRNLKEIIAELKRLISCGFKEVVLTGTCLGDYHYRDFDLADVIASLIEIDGDFRIRLSSIEPQLISDKLLATFSSPKVCAHLHIPMQSGDNTILKRMNRQYTQKGYLSLIAKIKKRIKDAAVTTDVLVGFPTETEKNFRNTVNCLKEALPLRTHIFSFSPRKGTVAFDLKPPVEPQVVKERVSLLKQVAGECSYEFRKHFLGRQLTVLIESQPDKEDGKFSGYSENYIRVKVEDATKRDVNRLIQVKVKTIEMNSTRAWI